MELSPPTAAPSTLSFPLAFPGIAAEVNVTGEFVEGGRSVAYLRCGREQRIVDATGADVRSPRVRRQLWAAAVLEGTRRERARRRIMESDA
jgi:hypothetical protein